MTFPLTEDTHYDTIVFVACEGQDFQGAVFRDGPPGSDWTLRYRFRYHADDKVWGSEDRKSWSGYTIPAATVAEHGISPAVNALREMSGKLSELAGGDLTELYVNGDGLEALVMMMAHPWCHITVLPGGAEKLREHAARKRAEREG